MIAMLMMMMINVYTLSRFLSREKMSKIASYRQRIQLLCIKIKQLCCVAAVMM